MAHDVILILEHPAVFTLGKRGGRENLVVSEEFLKSRNIAIIQTERGGNITYHGPGQIVLYPIVNLELKKTGVSEFVHALEEVMIRTASDFGVTALRDKKNHGVWVKKRQIDGSSLQQNITLVPEINSDLDNNSDLNNNIDISGVSSNAKLGSIGLSVKRGISFHGLALNVNLDLTPFGWINPCGMAGISMTSLENERAKNIDIKSVKEKLLHHFKKLTSSDL
ncbi:MAG: lipoyl(octanoyl) transferase LipB [Desulfamplus sp.]|nr:lipoyl(octanoyl) transferase LipB [Desulfamplus sp.]MBF0257521.1 lipoyl(octanoyl) transferase LipB [Desulfamplus sp.]